MLDQHFTKDWNEVHEDFTSDLHSTLLKFGRYQRTRDAEPKPIEVTYHPEPQGTPGPLSALVRAGFALVVTVALLGGALAVLTSQNRALAAPPAIVLL